MTYTRQEKNRKRLSLQSGSFRSGYAMSATTVNSARSANGFNTMAQCHGSITKR